jgi:hypothetical protein
MNQEKIIQIAMLKTVLSVSGKPGLYKMISQGKSLLVIESLADKKRIPAYSKDKIISLGDITIAANEEEVPLYKVLNRIKEKENLQTIPSDILKASTDELHAYFAEVLPEYDRERVYPTDIKRLMNWYNILLEAGITEFAPEEEIEEKQETEESEEEKENNKPKEDVKKELKVQKAVAPKNNAASQKTATPTKQKPAMGKMRQRTKAK